MGSLTTCLAQAGDLLSPQTRQAIIQRAQELRQQGMTSAEASRQAVADILTQTKTGLAEIETAVKDGATLYETPPETPAAKAEAEAAVSRVDQVVRDMPELQVRMDGMDAPMPVADFLAAVKAEADEMAADAPLMQIAAECALMNGL
jgi:uncharacterized protein YoaH (UPF0181 family)